MGISNNNQKEYKYLQFVNGLVHWLEFTIMFKLVNVTLAKHMHDSVLNSNPSDTTFPDKHKSYYSSYALGIIHHGNTSNTISTYPKTFHAHNANTIRKPRAHATQLLCTHLMTYGLKVWSLSLCQVYRVVIAVFVLQGEFTCAAPSLNWNVCTMLLFLHIDICIYIYV